MWKTRAIIFSFLISISHLYAMPERFEVWFLSINKVGQIEHLLQEAEFKSVKIAQALQCQPMGDYCFDPQVGLYKPGEHNQVKEKVLYEELDKTQKYKNLDSASSLDRQLVNCEDDKTFNIFCGNAKDAKKSYPKFEVWVDISGTMKEVDFSGHHKSCYRETFVKSLDASCPFNKKMAIHLFNESKKESGNMTDVCLNYGLNEADRLVDQIKQSDAKFLLIITDIYEAHERFVDFIETSGKGTIRGLKEPFYARDMHTKVKSLVKNCQ